MNDNGNNPNPNPPDYNPDIINNQLITTFGTTTAPNNFAFGSVNVRPVEHQHLEHTFNNTDLTQEQIENVWINDTAGVDIHESAISQEQPIGQGAPINESTLTIFKYGKYKLSTLGVHQISTAPAPNNNQWVIPAIMDVRIPLIENQSIDHSGTYRIVQRTVNGQTGLIIEETGLIPEPEEEPQENNSNTRFMIIDEEEENNNNNNTRNMIIDGENNNNNGQMVLRGQSNVRGLPDPSGEDIEGTFDINIPPPTIIDAIDSNGYYKFNGNSLISGTNQDYNLNVDVTPSVLDSISIPKNENSFNILDYNQENNTNYVGVKSIQLTPPEYISCKQLIPSQTSNENMNENNQLIVDNWTININNNSNLWKMFDPTNTASICGLRENSGETLNIFNDSTTPPIPNKIIYKYFRMSSMDNDYIFHKYRILFVGSMNQTTWNTILDIDFSQIDNYDMIYYNEASNAIEIPFVNDIDYKYYQFKTYDWDTWLDNGFTYWNILNCQDATPTPTINNYNEYTSEHPLTINTNGTGVISIPNGYTGLGNVNYEVDVPPPTITEPVTSNGYYKFEGNTLIPGTEQDYNLYINIPITNTTITNLSTKGYQHDENGYYIMASVPENINTYCKTIKQYLSNNPTEGINNWEDLVNTFGNMTLTGQCSYTLGTYMKKSGVCINNRGYAMMGSINLNNSNWSLATSDLRRACGKPYYITIKYNSNNECWIIKLQPGYNEGDYYNTLPSTSNSISTKYLNIEYNNTTYNLNKYQSDPDAYIIYLKFYSSGIIEQITP